MTSDRSRQGAASAGIGLFSLGIFCFALNDALAKWLVTDYAVGQVLLVRSLGAALVLVPLAWRKPGSLRLPDQWGLHALRVACMAADSFAFYFATKTMPLADVMTFYLAAPLLITALSGPFLGERIGPFRWSAVLVGFVGVLIALRPTNAAFSLGALIALAGSGTFAAAITITRKLRNTHWLPLIVWQFLGAGLVGAAASADRWVQPRLFDLGLMALVGLISMGCFICITKALKLVDASVVAPFQYASILWAVMLGWLIWGDVPDGATTLGIVVIVASGLAVWWRERKVAPFPEAVPVP